MDASSKAPGRGKYNRRASRGERVLAQRERLLHSTALAATAGTLTVTRVLSIAGVGRATFYEYFDDAEHALSQVTEHVNVTFRRALDGHHSGHENILEVPRPSDDPSTQDSEQNRAASAVEQLFATWLECVRELPLFWKCALTRGSLPLSPPALILQSAVLMCLRLDAAEDSGALAEADLELRAFLLAAGAQALALALANRLTDGPQPESTAGFSSSSGAAEAGQGPA